MKKMRVGVVGCGAIGSVVVDYLVKGRIPHLRLGGVCEIDPVRREEINRRWRIRAVKDLARLVTSADLVVETAVVSVVRDLLGLCIRNQKDLMVLSVGGLLGCEDLLKRAEKAGIRVLVPSGAISGIDALKSAALGRIKRITLTTYKPPSGLAGVEYIKRRGIDLSSLKESEEVFSGTVRQAVRHFPKNINVAATVALAVGRMRGVYVRIVADPTLSTNVHELVVEGSHGRIFTRTENLPSPDNPRTSFMAVLSALRRLRDYETKGLCIGT